MKQLKNSRATAVRLLKAAEDLDEAHRAVSLLQFELALDAIEAAGLVLCERETR